MVNDVKAVYTLFENEIHQLTPLISEEINKAIDTYPHDWILDAIKESAKNGVRKWKYINAILESWKANGKGSKKATGRKKGKDNWSL